MSLAVFSSVASCLLLEPPSVDEMKLRCGSYTFTASRKELVEDFVHFDALFGEEKPFYALPEEYAYGWQIMFSNHNDPYFEGSTPVKQLEACIRLTGSKFWSKVIGYSSDIAAEMGALSLEQRTKLHLERPISANIIQAIVSRQKALQVVDVRMHHGGVLRLHHFENCANLQELRLNKSYFAPFAKPERLTSLHTVVLAGGILQKGIVPTLAALPALRSLSLQGSTLGDTEGLYPLKGCTGLTRLTLTNLQLLFREKQLQANIHHLKRALPATVIVPDVTLVDYTEFRDVLTTERNENSFGPGETEMLTQAILERLLDTNEQDQIQPQDYVRHGDKSSFYRWENFVSVDENLLQTKRPLGASPIKLLDRRKRIAMSQPTSTIESQTLPNFWSAVVELDVSLIVAVKELEGCEGYIPLKKQGRLSFTTQDGERFEVECTNVEELKKGMTVRTVLVNGKEVKHLHKDIVDGAAMQGEDLCEFMEILEKLERERPHSQTVIHCLQGVGRTGFTFACLLVKELMRQAQPAVEWKLDLEKLLSGLRQQRKKMILTPLQLKSIHRFFAYLYKKRNSS